jgi:metallo-beta-lactamase family protein
MKLTFLGAAGTVTGSKYLLETDDEKIMIDCGMFQGLKEFRLLNWQQPEFDPASITTVLLTHAHLDHTGYLPRLVKLGFKGKIFGTSPTLKAAEIILKDAAKIQEEEAERANKEGYSKHKPALAFYTVEDVINTIGLFQVAEENEWAAVLKNFRARFLYNGHILGSTFIEVETNGKTLVFSGDIGREDDLLLYTPKKPEKADVLLIESTYGGKIHAGEATIIPQLESIINETVARGGSLFVPSFAVERTQLLMLMLWQLLKNKKIPKVQMIMDSPMGANVLDLFHHSRKWHKLAPDECDEMCSHFTIVKHFRETLEIREDKNPKIVIAGSGMVTGGRILNYLEKRAGNTHDTLLFAGYQAEGTRGRKILEGAKEIKIYGKTYPFKMQVKQLEGLSAHGDQHDLLCWLSKIQNKPRNVFIVHGEKEQATALQKKLQDEKKWNAQLPFLNQVVEV